MPVLCEGTSRMTRAASDCTSEHERNYFDSRLMSEIAIFHQLTWQQRVLGLSYPYDKGKFDILISPGNFPASSRGEVDPSHKKLFVRRPAGCARAVCLERRGKRIGSPAAHREFRFR